MFRPLFNCLNLRSLFSILPISLFLESIHFPFFSLLFVVINKKGHYANIFYMKIKLRCNRGICQRDFKPIKNRTRIKATNESSLQRINPTPRCGLQQAIYSVINLCIQKFSNKGYTSYS